ncbi:putative SP-containing protein [Vairimorpha necatrix]|uniref:SP-containing protein n=1 Tax=Vairimorpha necatrix TaxID=6039 RepID=A0AAX4J8I0_9MICR
MFWGLLIVFLHIHKYKANPLLEEKTEETELCKKHLSINDYTFKGDYYNDEKFKRISKIIFYTVLGKIKFPLDKHYHYFSRDTDVNYKISFKDLKYAEYMNFIMNRADDALNLDDSSQEDEKHYKAQAIRDLLAGLASYTKGFMHALVCINYRDNEIDVETIKLFLDKYLKITQNTEEKTLSLAKFNLEKNNFFNDLNESVNIGKTDDVSTREADLITRRRNKRGAKLLNESAEMLDNDNNNTKLNNTSIQDSSSDDNKKNFIGCQETNDAFQSNTNINIQLNNIITQGNNPQDNNINKRNDSNNETEEMYDDGQENKHINIPADLSIDIEADRNNITRNNNFISQDNSSSIASDSTDMFKELTSLMQHKPLITTHDNVNNLGMTTYYSPNYLSGACLLHILFRNSLGLN